MAKRNSEYFDDFETMAGFSCRAAEYLHAALSDFNPETLAEKRAAMHEVEHAADEAKHSMLKRLAKEFVTPIEREDIILLANELDEVTDRIEDVLIRIYMYNIKSIRPEAMQFTDLLVRSCKALLVATQEFSNFHKSKTLNQAIIDVNTLEEEGDEIYISAMRRLYKKEKGCDTLEVMAWSETFDRLEDCCDTCEHVANALETVLMKNS